MNVSIKLLYSINFNVMKKRLYFDMDGVLVDFESGLAQQDEQTLKEYEGRYDENPGLFGQMLPMEGAIDAVHVVVRERPRLWRRHSPASR